MTSKTSQTNGKNGKTAKPAKAAAKPATPNEFQQSLIDSGLKQAWVMTNITGSAPAQDDLAAWQKLLEPMAAIMDVEDIAQRAHDTFYGVEAEEVVDEEDDEPVAPVKGKKNGKATTVQGQKGQPAINVTVQQAKEIGDMSPGELLNLLATEPDNDDAYDALVSHPRVQPLLKKTDRIMSANKGGGFDLARTQTYWRRLRSPNSKPISKFLGFRLVTIDKALGRVERTLLHPLFAGEFINAGVDDYGLDWTEVDRDHMEAALWARTTKRIEFPRDPDPYEAYEQLASEELNTRWQTILDDYLEFLDDGGQRVTLVHISPGQTKEEAEKPVVKQPATDASSGRLFELKAKW